MLHNLGMVLHTQYNWCSYFTLYRMHKVYARTLLVPFISSCSSHKIWIFSIAFIQACIFDTTGATTMQGTHQHLFWDSMKGTFLASPIPHARPRMEGIHN